MPEDTRYYKVNYTENILKEYNLKKVPSLLIFQSGKMIGKVEGYYSTDEKEEFMKKINELLK